MASSYPVVHGRLETRATPDASGGFQRAGCRGCRDCRMSIPFDGGRGGLYRSTFEYQLLALSK